MGQALVVGHQSDFPSVVAVRDGVPVGSGARIRAGFGAAAVGLAQGAGQAGELLIEAARRVGAGQAAHVHDGLPIRARVGPDEHPAAPDKEGQEQASQRRQARDQRGQLPWVVGDGQADPLPVPGEGERAGATRQLDRLPDRERAGRDRQLGQAGGVQLVHRLRRAAVHAQVAFIRDQADPGGERGREGGFQLPADVNGSRQEHAGEPQLVGTRIWDLDHAFGGQAGGVHRDERDRLVEDHLPGPVGDLEDRRVPVADDEDTHPVHVDRVVDPQIVVVDRAARLRGVAHVRVERQRLAARLAGGDVGGREAVQRHREGLEVRRRHEAAGAELVQRRHRVGERGPADQQPVGLVPEQAAQGYRAQQAQQRQVEHQVAQFAAVPLLGRHPAVTSPEPELAAAQHGRGGVQGGGRVEGALVPGGLGQPGQVARRGRWQRPGRADQPDTARHHAAGQGGEQQQVDRGEPGRREHVEQG